ncbi:MAG: amidohydrolase [Clostridiales bacterium]|nr:amidohydrolase [Clostridiales bacterium]
MDFEIIDFHTHPYKDVSDFTCIHRSAVPISIDETPRLMSENGISLFCGSIVSHDKTSTKETDFELLKSLNDTALYLKDYYKGRYIPGFHVHPNFVEESIKEIDRFHANGVNLVGELVPWRVHYNSYACENMKTILDYASEKGMILSIHPTTPDDMDKLCENHPNLIIVGAHPGEGEQYNRHVARAKKYDNYYVDISGSGIHRYGATKRLVNEIGVEKVIFGSDYAISNLQMYVDGVKNDHLLTEKEKRFIFSENAKRILNI